MSKNRIIPFGYRVTNGKVDTSPVEVPVVVEIFQKYAHGYSLMQIAEYLNNGDVQYGNGSSWNRNMVKRILENSKYLGNHTYPQLVSKNIFQKVNEKKSARYTRKSTNVSEDIIRTQKMTYCKECGHKLSRLTDTGYWTCNNRECFRFDYILTDQMILSACLNVMNTVIANHSLLECEANICKFTPSAKAIRMQKEIEQKIDSATIDYDRIKADILELAAERYNCCTYDSNVQSTSRLMKILNNQEQLNTIDIDLLETCVSRILVSHYCTIELEYINGVTIQNITERENQ